MKPMLHPLHPKVRRVQVASRAAADNLVRAAQTNDVELRYSIAGSTVRLLERLETSPDESKDVLGSS